MVTRPQGMPRLLTTAALVCLIASPYGFAATTEGSSSPAATQPSAPVEEVSPRVETAPVPHTGDAADDPAIWVDTADPSKSLVIGSDKQGGIGVYDLKGQQLEYVKAGNVNNVDLRDGFMLGGKRVAIVAGTNRTDNSIALYSLDPATRRLENVAARAVVTAPKSYGACLYRSPRSGKVYYFVTSKKGAVEQYELIETAGGKVDAKRVREFKLESVVEGCVADDELGHLYIGEEVAGIWKFGAEPDAGDDRVRIDKAGKGGNLTADVEGLTIAYGKDGKGYLIASSQGNHTFVVYTREGDNRYVKTFRIVDGGGLDGAMETDGIDVTTASLGDEFPHGLFVAQDGFNDDGNQNFKLVPLEQILPQLPK